MATDLMRSERAASLGALGGQLATLWSRQPRARRAIAGLTLVALGGALAWLALADRGERWVTVGLAASDREGLARVTALQSAGVEARLTGQQIQVPPRRQAQAQAMLATAPDPALDEPAGDRSFWDLRPQDPETSKRALERALERQLMALAPIQQAQVHVALGRKHVIKDLETLPSASVTLRLRPEQDLTPAQVLGVQQLVAKAVDGLRTGEVAVIDQNGLPLTSPRAGARTPQAEVEDEVNGKVRAVLEPLLGADRVKVVTTAELEPALAADARPVPRRLQVTVLVDRAAVERAQGEQAASATPPPSASAAEDARVAAPPLQTWTELARQAAGIDDARGDTLMLQAARFAAPPSSSGGAPEPHLAAAARPDLPPRGASPDPAALSWPRWWPVAAAGSAVALLALGLRVTRRRPPAPRTLAHAGPPVIRAATPEPVAAEPVSPSARLSVELAQVGHVLAADLDATALVITAWLAEDGEDDADRAGSPTLRAAGSAT